MFYRSFPFFLAIPLISWDKSIDYTSWDLVLYLGYGFFNSIGLLLSYVALSFAQVGNVTSINFNLPIPASFLSLLILREPISLCDVFLFVVNFTGIILVTKPPFIFGLDPEDSAAGSQSYDDFFGAVIAVFGLLGIAMSAIFSRMIAYRGNLDFVLIVVSAAISGVLLPGAVILFARNWDPITSISEVILLVCVAVLSLLANVFIALGLKYESVLVISVMSTFCVPIAFLVGTFVLDEIPDVVSALGACLIIISTVLCLRK